MRFGLSGEKSLSELWQEDPGTGWGFGSGSSDE